MFVVSIPQKGIKSSISYACSQAVKRVEHEPLALHISIEGNGQANLEMYVFRAIEDNGQANLETYVFRVGG